MSSKHKRDWDDRISCNYRLWMSDGIDSDEQMLLTGKRDLNLLLPQDFQIKNFTILEIGCGVGRLLYHAAEIFNKAYGVDISETAISIAKKILDGKKNVELFVTDGDNLPPTLTNRIDIVISFATLFSIPTRAFCSYLIEANRVLKSDGILAIQLYLGKEIIPDELDSLSIRSYSTDRLCNTLHAAGFDNVELEEIKNYPIPTNLEQLQTKAYVVRTRKKSVSFVQPEFLKSLLVSGNFHPNTQNIYELSMYYEYLKVLIQNKNFKECSKIGQVCIELCRKIGDSELEQQVKALLQHVSEVENITPTHIIFVPNEDLSFESVKNWLVPRYKNVPLSNIVDPVTFELGLIAKTKHARNVVVFGSGSGILLRCLQDQFPVSTRIFCFEPIEALKKVHQTIPRVEFIELDELEHLEEFELIINPCYVPLFPESLNRTKEIHHTKDVWKRYTVAVVSPIDGGSFPIARYIANSFKQLGYRVLFFDFSPYLPAREAVSRYYLNDIQKNNYFGKISKLCSETLVEACKIERPQIVFCLSQAPILPDALSFLRKENILTCMWFVEDFRRFTYWQQVADSYDYFFIIQREPALSELRKKNPNTYYVPIACDPN
ncbi:MAG: methyltransferase domain-containing protein, partial [Deltaproteobacteria bacterium]|nr:methyltransferase domain-containing protein [Deltaproteobacteria bacterium]